MSSLFKIIFLVILGFIFFFIYNFRYKSKDEVIEVYNYKKLNIAEKGDSILLNVANMTCGFCSKSLEKNLKKSFKIFNAIIDIDKQTVLIILNKGFFLTEDEIFKMVSDEAGVKIRKINYLQKSEVL